MLIKDPYQFLPEYAAGFTSVCQRAGLDLHATAALLQKSASSLALLDPDTRDAFDSTLEKSAGIFGRLLSRLGGAFGRGGAGKVIVPELLENATPGLERALARAKPVVRINPARQYRPEFAAAGRMGTSPGNAATLEKMMRGQRGSQITTLPERAMVSAKGQGAATGRGPRSWRFRGGPAAPQAQPFNPPPRTAPKALPLSGVGRSSGAGGVAPKSVIPPTAAAPVSSGGAGAGGVPPANPVGVSAIPSRQRPPVSRGGKGGWGSADMLGALAAGGSLAAGTAGSEYFTPGGNAFSDSLGEQGRDVATGIGAGGLSAAALALLGRRVPYLKAIRPGALIGGGALAGGVTLPAYHAGERALRFGMMPAGFTPSYLNPDEMARGGGAGGIRNTDIGRRLQQGREELAALDQRISALKTGSGEGLAGGLATARNLSEIRELEARRREVSQSLSRVVAGVERDQARWQGEAAERLSTMTDLNRRMTGEGDRYARFLNRANDNSFGGLLANAWGNMTGVNQRADQYLGEMQALQSAMGRERNIAGTSLIPNNWRN
jgi:hypothetical protein